MKIVKMIKSKDEIITYKFVLSTDDEYLIEATYVDYPNKHIICYSTQVGCQNECKFCSNGINKNYKRNLLSEEIFEQCELIYGKCIHNKMSADNSKNKPILFSAMGIGDPLNNYHNYINSVRLINDKLHIYPEDHLKNKFAISTCAPGQFASWYLKDLIEDTADLDFKLQISLHSANLTLRECLMPGAGDLARNMQAIIEYMYGTGRVVEFNVTLMDGINDSIDQAKEIFHLFKIFREYGVHDKVIIKINKFNDVDGCKFHGSDKSVIDEFMKQLTHMGIKSEYYETNGSDINAACGQLSHNTKGGN